MVDRLTENLSFVKVLSHISTNTIANVVVLYCKSLDCGEAIKIGQMAGVEMGYFWSLNQGIYGEGCEDLLHMHLLSHFDFSTSWAMIVESDCS